MWLDRLQSGFTNQVQWSMGVLTQPDSTWLNPLPHLVARLTMPSRQWFHSLKTLIHARQKVDTEGEEELARIDKRDEYRDDIWWYMYMTYVYDIQIITVYRWLFRLFLYTVDTVCRLWTCPCTTKVGRGWRWQIAAMLRVANWAGEVSFRCPCESMCLCLGATSILWFWGLAWMDREG